MEIVYIKSTPLLFDSTEVRWNEKSANKGWEHFIRYNAIIGRAKRAHTLASLNWRASEASETLSGVYKFELVRYVYIYIYICMEVRMSY